jgi:hypothetical protein
MRGSFSQSAYRASSLEVFRFESYRWHLSVSLSPILVYLTAAGRPNFPVTLATVVVVTDVRGSDSNLK